MINLVKRVEKINKEFAQLYREGVIDLVTDGTVQVTLELFQRLSKDYDVNIKDRGDGDYPIGLEVIIGYLKFFTILDVDEYMEMKMNE